MRTLGSPGSGRAAGLSEKGGLIGRMRKIDFDHHFSLFVKCFIPTLSLVSGMAFMLIVLPSSKDDVFMFGLSYVGFAAKVLVLVFMYNVGNFFVREISAGVM